MGFSVTSLALGASLMTAAVDKFAEQIRGGWIRSAAYCVAGVASKPGGDTGCRANAGRQGGNQPGISHLVGGDTLVQIAVTICAPDSGLGLVCAAVAVDIVAWMTIVAVHGYVGIVR